MKTPQERFAAQREPVEYPEAGTIDHRPIVPGKFGQPPTKLPCVECPLARASTPGYLGGYTVRQYIDVLHGVGDIACHLSPGFPANPAEQRSCTGVAMYRANVGDIALARNAQAAVNAVGPNTELVFAAPVEFAKHHEKELGAAR